MEERPPARGFTSYIALISPLPMDTPPSPRPLDPNTPPEKPAPKNKPEASGSDRVEELKGQAKAAADKASKEIKVAADKASKEIKVASNQLVDKVRELIEEGNVRRVHIKREGKTLLEIPLTVGVGAGAAALLMTPILAAVGALAALAADITLVVEREVDGEQEQ